MLKTNNLVRKMHACETMGATTVICTDKTGTLTQNKMQVKECTFGKLTPELAEGIAVNSTASLDFSESQPRPIGNPTEGALLLWLHTNKYDYRRLKEASNTKNEIPFSTERKYMSTTVFSAVTNREVTYTKGAPEIVFGMCDSSDIDEVTLKESLQKYQDSAYRTLGFAIDKHFVGVVAIEDPVREDVPDAVKECMNAGIMVKIVTGDTPGTAKQIGREIGLWADADTDRNIITGTELAELSDEKLQECVLDLKIIARARPMDKKRLVEALQARNQVVAVTGDGTNDAPALHQANVGLSMGAGTAVAKEASDITIIDNSFSSIGKAVMWGRSLYKNIQRFLLFQLTVNVTACCIVFVGALVGKDSPLTVTQMLWINLIMDTFGAMALASLPPSKDVMKDKPRKRGSEHVNKIGNWAYFKEQWKLGAFIINKPMLGEILSVGIFFFVLLFAFLLIFQHADINSMTDFLNIHFSGNGEVSHYEQTLLFSIFVWTHFFYLFNARAFETGESVLLNLFSKKFWSKGFWTIVCVIVFGQLLIDYFEKSWNATAKQYELDGSLYQSSVKPSMDVKSGYSRIFDMEFKAAYLKTFGKHTLDATFVYTQRKGFSEFVSAGRKNYISTSMDQLFAGSVDGLTNDGSAAESASMGYVGRLKYDYLSKYIIEFSGRYDGNDNFHPDKRWGFFPAVSAVWMISDENFMQKLNDKNILNSLKLRASYGETGISDGVTRFGYMALYNQGAMKEYYNAGNILNVTFSEGNLVNPLALTWYTRKSFNVGFDFASLNNRLEGSLDYFYYKTSGYLMSPNNIYATTLGKPLPEITSGSKHRRAGFELNLRYKEKRGNWYYEIGGNISYYNQLWEQLDSEDLATLKNPYTRQTHEKDYFYSMYLSDGLFQNKEQILNSPRPLPSTETSMGDIKYIDANGDGKIDSNDMRRVGQPSMPHLNYGFDFRVEYKGWSLSALFQGTGDRYIAMGQQMQRGDYASVITKFQADYWTPENTDARFPRVTKAGYPNGENNALVTDFFNMNAKYFRLKNLQISYNLKRDLLKNCNFIQGCRITLSGTNLFTVSDVLDFTDPEAKMIEPDKIEKNLRSISGASYPVFRTYSLGLNVEF